MREHNLITLTNERAVLDNCWVILFSYHLQKYVNKHFSFLAETKEFQAWRSRFPDYSPMLVVSYWSM